MDASTEQEIRAAIEKERSKRVRTNSVLSSIEIVKISIATYQICERTKRKDVSSNPEMLEAKSYHPESRDRIGILRGRQSAIDRLLFNVNYWLYAYEDRIVDACETSKDAHECLDSIAAWTSHPMRLNTLSQKGMIELFERFCIPFTANKRRRNGGSGKGPVHDFKKTALKICSRTSDNSRSSLLKIIEQMEKEARLYEMLADKKPLEAFMDILPVWCLQGKIPLVAEAWWNDSQFIRLVSKMLEAKFSEQGYGESQRRYFMDSLDEAIDSYERYISDDEQWIDFDTTAIFQLITSAKLAQADSETEGYGSGLPEWLIPKEQIIWNIVVCALYGPAYTRPLLAESVSQLSHEASKDQDFISELADAEFNVYRQEIEKIGGSSSFSSFTSQPLELQRSTIAQACAIPHYLDILGYQIMPKGVCYPEQLVERLSGAEIECIAFLEHRRWMEEKRNEGWTQGKYKNLKSKKNPWLIPWENLPESVKEIDRKFAASILSELEKRGLVVSR
ncbi:RyR domain-containing protein [Slackia exigua]|uniref:RyR domain-containing protein n=1 Tax=Slackia exigua TaxID=84109 RepID=UPI0020049208|nr:RyR domain-containing protein [Slackia exigua]MCK6138834.1 hypothetical protein [Slackia exigua]